MASEASWPRIGLGKKGVKDGQRETVKGGESYTCDYDWVYGFWAIRIDGPCVIFPAVTNRGLRNLQAPFFFSVYTNS